MKPAKRSRPVKESVSSARTMTEEGSTAMYRGECNKTHGGSGTRLHGIWKQMRIRCNCVTNPTYRFYGARGIKICNEWDNFAVFREWALSHGYTDELSIERIDCNGNYCPENCCWIPRNEQSKNTRNCKHYTFNGITMTHNDWARYIGINPATLTGRIQRHGLEKALSTPNLKNGKRITD